MTGDTIIGEGTKLDCQIHIGHGVVIGKHCLIAAQVGISGKTIIEDHVTIYGQVGIAQNVRIGSESIILGQSGVTKSIPGKPPILERQLRKLPLLSNIWLSSDPCIKANDCFYTQYMFIG